MASYDASVALEGPAPVSLTPCRDGWIERDVDGFAFCDWLTDDERSAPSPQTMCPEGFSRIPGESACTRVGQECPDDLWPTDLPRDRNIHFVSPTGGGFEFTRESPGSINDAVMLASDGDIIAISKGEHVAWRLFDLQRSLTFWGACAAQTVLNGSVGVVAGETTLRDVRVRDDGSPLTVIQRSGSTTRVELSGVILEGSELAPVYVDSGATLIARDLLIASRPTANYAFAVYGGRAKLSRARVTGSRDVAVWVTGGATLELEDVVLTQHTGSAIVLDAAATLHAEGLAIDGGGHAVAVQVREGATMTCAHCAVMVGAGPSVFGVEPDSALSLSQTHIAGETPDAPREVAVRVDRGAEASLNDVVIDGGALRIAVQVVEGASQLERVWIRSAEIGLLASTDARIVGSDLRIERLVFPSDGSASGAIFSIFGATIEARRVAIERASGVGLFAAANGRLSASDISASSILARCRDAECRSSELGVGVAVRDGFMDLQTFRITDSPIGLMLAPGAMVDLARGEILGCDIGINVQVPNYDRTRLYEQVRIEVPRGGRNVVAETFEPPGIPDTL